MNMYKFQDKVDGNYCFIIANSLEKAKTKVESLTSVPFKYISSNDLQTLDMQIVVVNNILPF